MDQKVKDELARRRSDVIRWSRELNKLVRELDAEIERSRVYVENGGINGAQPDRGGR